VTAVSAGLHVVEKGARHGMAVTREFGILAGTNPVQGSGLTERCSVRGSAAAPEIFAY